MNRACLQKTPPGTSASTTDWRHRTDRIRRQRRLPVNVIFVDRACRRKLPSKFFLTAGAVEICQVNSCWPRMPSKLPQLILDSEKGDPGAPGLQGPVPDGFANGKGKGRAKGDAALIFGAACKASACPRAGSTCGKEGVCVKLNEMKFPQVAFVCDGLNRPKRACRTGLRE